MTRRYYGEEAEILTPAQMRHHRRELAKLHTMSLEELQALEVPPPSLDEAEYTDARTGAVRRIPVVRRCPDCGSLYCAKGGGAESLIPCQPYPPGTNPRGVTP